ncbi:hypothetical protein TARUN_2717 [Trichoderma arundinaceum]|uniref:Nudix hydrolase domain-containing protein n=1 Tax=Trichoderma arundinaceum TaxID=490622 RepID=A0A395NTU8_TRIAR|nr:hypothetical protein TARUN_2717 [Trichoderma arundinaceum]
MASLALSASSLGAPSSIPPTVPDSIHTWIITPVSPNDMGSFYDVIRRCNKFEEGKGIAMWEFAVLDNSVPVGYMLPEHVDEMRWENTSFSVSKSERKIHLDPVVQPGDDVVEICRREFISLCEKNVDNLNGCFRKWLRKRSDFHPIRGLDVKLAGLVIASPARGIFGIVTTGVHMNMFTVRSGGIHVWVSRRSQNVTYAGKLDQLVAGAMDPVDKMDPLMTLKREAMEEAGLAVDISTKVVTWNDAYVGKVSAESMISFYDQKDHIAGSEEGHVEPGIRYTFDLEVGPDFVPYPQEPESIDGFVLKPVEEIKRDLKNAEWKPNCGLVMLDFLLRKGEIKEADDENFGLLRRSLHRKLPFRNL